MFVLCFCFLLKLAILRAKYTSLVQRLSLCPTLRVVILKLPILLPFPYGKSGTSTIIARVVGHLFMIKSKPSDNRHIIHIFYLCGIDTPTMS